MQITQAWCVTKENINCTRKRKCKPQTVYKAETLQLSWADSAAPPTLVQILTLTHTQGKAKVTRGSPPSELPWTLPWFPSQPPPALMETCTNCACQGRSQVPPRGLVPLQAEGHWVTLAPPPALPAVPVSLSTQWMLLCVEWWCFSSIYNY